MLDTLVKYLVLEEVLLYMVLSLLKFSVCGNMAAYKNSSASSHVGNGLNSSAAMFVQVWSNERYPTWWPFPDLSPRTFMFVILWPLFVHAVISWLRKRRSARAQLL